MAIFGTRLPLRTLLAVDFSCALAGLLAFVVLFDALVEVVGLPPWVVRTQVVANALYGVVGIALFAARRERFLGVIAAMNGVYALYCFGLAPTLYASGHPTGALFVFIEGAVIAALATLELVAIRARRELAPAAQNGQTTTR
jgi:hypothetical protein